MTHFLLFPYQHTGNAPTTKPGERNFAESFPSMLNRNKSVLDTSCLVE